MFLKLSFLLISNLILKSSVLMFDSLKDYLILIFLYFLYMTEE